MMKTKGAKQLTAALATSSFLAAVGIAAEPITIKSLLAEMTDPAAVAR